jgi:hypothetical protein
MPPKAKAKDESKKASSAKSDASKRKKKGPSNPKAVQIIELRDSLIAQGMDAEKVGMACKGMYRCDKLADEACLDGILEKLNAVKQGGGKRRRSKSRGSKPATKARSRSRSRSKSRSRKR